VVSDDPPADNSSPDAQEGPRALRQVMAHYLHYLSFILDSSAYNRFVRQFRNTDTLVPEVAIKKIGKVLERRGVRYAGEFFDYRLISALIRRYHEPEMTLDALFEGMTSKVGRRKLFLGIDQRVLELYNGQSVSSLLKYKHELTNRETATGFEFVDRDGVAIFKSMDGADRQIEELFTEAEVRGRLGHYLSYILQEPTACGAPCQGHGIEGKPCEIMTYRGKCHFHR